MAGLKKAGGDFQVGSPSITHPAEPGFRKRPISPDFHDAGQGPPGNLAMVLMLIWGNGTYDGQTTSSICRVPDMKPADGISRFRSWTKSFPANPRQGLVVIWGTQAPGRGSIEAVAGRAQFPRGLRATKRRRLYEKKRQPSSRRLLGPKPAAAKPAPPIPI